TDRRRLLGKLVRKPRAGLLLNAQFGGRAACVPTRLLARLRGHRVEAQKLALPLRSLARLGQAEKSECASGEAGGRRGLGGRPMAMKTRTHFTFRVDTWGEGIVEHIAGVEDYQVALATFRATCERWPGTPITLRQGARVIEDSRRLRMAWSDEGRRGGR